MQALAPYPQFGAAGVAVAALDFAGDGRAAVVTGPGFGGRSLVQSTGAGTVPPDFLRFFAFNPAFLGGVWVA